MHDQENGTPSGDRTPQPAVPSTPSTEATRRELYDEVVAVHFNPSAEEVRRAAEDPENHWVPDYGPEAAGLTVFKVFGRYFAVWRSLEAKQSFVVSPHSIRSALALLYLAASEGAGKSISRRGGRGA